MNGHLSVRRILASVALLLLAGCGGGTYVAYAPLDEVRVSENGSDLVLVGLHGSCDKVLPPVVQQTPQDVKVSVPLKTKKGVCPAVGLSLDVPVHLDAPLGQRQVLDEQTRKVLPRAA